MLRRGLLSSCALMLFALVLAAPAWGQGPPPESDFAVTTLAKGVEKTGEPIAMAVLPDRRVLHTSRDGRVWLTTPNATTSLAGTIPVYSHDEDGLQGIAIDADFATNRWVYVYYAPPLSTPLGDAPGSAADPAAFEPFEGHNQLSRMKLTDAGTLDRSTEQEILRVPADRGICCHAGGEIDFDAQGNLYLSTGDDTNPFESDGYSPIDERATRNPAFDAQRTSANTNDLRGKLLRINVAADGTYTSPAGNLFSPGQMGTRPEIYAMGFRNPFRFAVDRETGWVYLGDYGPDAGASNPERGPGGQVEFNLIKAPGNYGWPYCHGKNDAYNDFDFATGASGTRFNCAAPENASPRNTGLVDLGDSAQPAWIAYDGGSVPEFGTGSESPMGGPTYHYDAANPSQTKFPAYYDGKNFAYEWGRGWIKALSVGADGSLLAIEPFLDSFDIKAGMNIEFGPDGALYVLDYGTGFFTGDQFSALYRVDYVQGIRSPIAEVAADRTSGPVPLTVAFSSQGSRDPDGTAITYAWDFGDGSAVSTAANPTHIYETAGKYTAVLTVTDAAGQTGSASVNITAGNTAPQVTVTVPPEGGIFEYGDTISYRISVTDPEDGAIDCNRVRLDSALGHNEHTHGDQNKTGCSGEVRVPAAWEDKSQHSFYVLTASYTDSGAAAPGLELTGSDQVVLEHRTQQAEFFDAQNGLQTVNHAGAAGGRRVGYVDGGDWLRFDDLNLSGIDSVVARITSTNTSGMELRADSPTGQLLATIPVPNTGSVDNYRDLPAVPVTDPGRTFDLYVVFTAASMDLDEFTFLGAGVTGNGSPVLDASADPLAGTFPLEVDFSATATDPEGTPVSLVWDFGVAGAPKPTTGTASYTYTRRGRYTASVTATDGDGRKSVRTFAIEVLAQCGDTATDEFNGTSLDTAVWSRIIREDTSGYRVENGALVVNAVAGDMYGGNTSAKNIIAQPAPSGAWTATTEVTLDHVGTYEQAGMLLHASDQQFLKLAFIKTPDGRNIEFIRQRNGSPDDQGAADRSPLFAADAADTVFLRMRSDGAAVTAAYSVDGTAWTPVGRSQPLDGITDPVIGVSAFNGAGTPARFNAFTLASGSGPDDEFDGSELDACRWSTILREDFDHYRVTGGKLEIDAVDGDMTAGNTNAKNVVLQDAPDGAWQAVTKVALPQGEEYEQAGLIVHSTDANFAKLVLLDIPGQGWRVEFGQSVNGEGTFDEALDRSGALPEGINESGIWLRVRSNGLALIGSWSADGETWTSLGRTRPLGAMPDPKVGLAAFNGNGQAATFDFFRLTEGGELACQTPAAPESGYRMLFDGTQASLNQWRMAGPGSFPLQGDCSILSVGGLGLLYHPDAFESYSLKLDWKMAGDDNAGVFVGFKNPGNDPFNAVNQGHEIQIDATDDPSHTTGAIYGFQAAVAAARDAALKPPGQWNAYEIVVQGDRIQVFLNGSKINDYTDTDAGRMNAPSLIGLQNHGTGDDVFFRNVQIKGIPTPGTPAPSLELTAPQNGAVIEGDEVTVTGTTNGEKVQIRVGTHIEELTPAGGTFTATVPLELGSNRINVNAYNADGVPAAASVTVLSRDFGQRVGGLTDPAGDDDGPGTYVYPTNSAFNDGAFDLEAMDVFADGDQVRFVTKIAGSVTNPFGGDKISLQRVNVYLGAGDGAAVPALPGTNMDTASPWSAAVVIDGRFNTAGVYAPDGTKLSGATLATLPQTREIIITVPRSALGDLDLATARYGTAMFGNAEGGEGIGFVRPVYDLAYWQNPGADMWWITEYRFGGGAGVWNDSQSHDSDTRDPNALDVIVGPGQTQAAVLDWRAGSPTRLPMLPLEPAADPGAPTVQAFADPASGAAPLEVSFSATGLDPDGGDITYAWTFSDGGTAFGSGASRTYAAAGTYSATVTVTDDEGDTASDTVSVTVTGSGSRAPEIVEATADRTSGAAPLRVLFQAVADDPDGDRLTYRWEFGDGGAAFGEEVVHRYLTAGTYQARLTVTDPAGESDTATIAITVTDPPGNRAPTVVAGAAPSSGKAPLAVAFSAQGTDPDGDVLTYAWVFGDGSPGVAGRRASHTYTRNGTFTARVTATDRAGNTAVDDVVITVGNPAGNQAPTVQAAADPGGGRAPLAVSFSAAANDPDGDAVTYVWEFGDGVRAGGQSVTHTYGAAGTYAARVTVTDAGGKTGQATVSVTVTAALTGVAGAQGVAPGPAVRTALAQVSVPSLAAFSARGLKVAATCGSDGAGAAALWASRATARRLGLRSRGLGRTRLTCVAGETVTVRLRPTRRVRNAIRAARPSSLRVTVAFALRDGAALRRTVTLR